MLASPRLLLCLPLGLCCACSSPTLQDGRTPTGSRSLAVSTDFRTLYAVSADEGAVSRVPEELTSITTLQLGGEPTRIARAQDRVFVTLRAERQVAVLRDDGRGLNLETKILVGAEPYGIVANELGDRIYVASSQSGRVDEIDADRLEILRSFSIPGEPRWLALHPAGRLYVASALGAQLSTVDLSSGEVVTGTLPGLERAGPDGTAFTLDRRITGDPAVTPDGEMVLVPALYVDNTTPVVEPSEGEVAPPPESGGGGGYGGSGPEPRMNPSVVLAPATGDGELLLEDVEVVRLGALNPEGAMVVGYVSSVAVSPDSALAYATIEGAEAVLAFPIDASDEPNLGERIFGAFGGPFAVRTQAVIAAPAGPRSVVFTSENQAFVHGFLGARVGQFGTRSIAPGLMDGSGRATPGRVEAAAQIAEPLPEPLYTGRSLFYANNDSRMSAPGSGLSCATCHTEGRNDGFTWTFARGPRQTPSLAGKVSETAPVRWEADRATVEEDARRTSQGLMGGGALDDARLSALANFVDSTRAVDVELKGHSDPSIERGRAIFFRADVGCGNCHAGARYTDNRTYPLYGMAKVKTRSLTGIAASAPYLHDGSAPTLADVVERSRDGSMGYTGGLSDAERADLVRFLQSL